MRAPTDAKELYLTRTPTTRRTIRLRIDQRCRVDGVLHSYLGPADLPDAAAPVHVFARREWLPNTPGQLPVTLVRDSDLDETVVPIRRLLLG